MALSVTALAFQAASALDGTHNLDNRGPKTASARALLARWLDTSGTPGPRTLHRVREAIRWLRSLRSLGPQTTCPACQRGLADPSAHLMLCPYRAPQE